MTTACPSFAAQLHHDCVVSYVHAGNAGVINNRVNTNTRANGWADA
jgi:hypothetical protein